MVPASTEEALGRGLDPISHPISTGILCFLCAPARPPLNTPPEIGVTAERSWAARPGLDSPTGKVPGLLLLSPGTVLAA